MLEANKAVENSANFMTSLCYYFFIESCYRFALNLQAF
ncbi:hypothetical protein LDG_5835 [Legionella drancourtii LLAP12]|uniref:Uncharacterized protein n=1 Tax=Legionella drancourtii LLAP12 TaxID=658187 RepID=G9EKU4_9GAMM|nr:hypothetical protein LDG_5835 [Legionella drancourtii LLAP12]